MIQSSQEILTEEQIRQTLDRAEGISPSTATYLSNLLINQMSNQYKLPFLSSPWALKQRVHEMVRELLEKGKRRLLIYGAGEHTKRLINDVDFSGIDLLGIVDKHRFGDHPFLGHTVFAPADIPSMAPDAVLISSQSFEDEIYQEISSLQNSHGIEVLKIYEESYFSLLREHIPRLRTEIQSDLEGYSGKKVVIYVAHIPLFSTVRQSVHLRQNNFATILLASDSAIDSSFLNRYFDRVYLCSFIEILNIISSLRPSLYHVSNETAQTYYLPVVAKLFSPVPVVCEFYDIRTLYMTYEDEVSFRGKEITDMIHATERFSFEKMDGILYKNSPEIEDILKSKYDLKETAMMEFQSYPAPDFFAKSSPYHQKKGGKRLVFAGGIPPSPLPAHFFGDFQIIGLCRELLNQGPEIHVYSRPFYNNHLELDDYVQLAEEHPRFYFNAGFLPDKITEEISPYDFGMLIFFFPSILRIQGEHIRTAIATKLFTYLEAGLPILVSEELVYMASLVKSQGLGIVCSREEIKNINATIGKYNYQHLRENVLKYRQRFSMKNMIHRLISFYDKVGLNIPG